MDPNLFHLDWERIGEVMAAIVVLAFMLERALSLLFEHRFFVNNLDEKGFKEPIALGLAFVVCRYWQFDAISVVILRETVTWHGELITAAVIAGGSKGAVKLFHDVLGVRSEAAEEKKKLRQLKAGLPVEG
jgi:hypothetical protein